MSLIDDRSVQRAMLAAHFYTGNIDGDFGPASLRAARNMAGVRSATYRHNWPDAKVRLAVEQAIMADAGCYFGKVDGISGPATQAAVVKWHDYLTFERPPLPDQALTHLPTVFPRQKDAPGFYGEPGTGHVQFEPPYPVFFAGKKVSKITLHHKCAESGQRILEAVKAEYGLERIRELGLDDYGGSFFDRPMRNGKTKSMHAYACAWDWDADRNQLNWTKATAYMAKPAYAAFIDCHYRFGWISLGRERNFDWMHFQAARL